MNFATLILFILAVGIAAALAVANREIVVFNFDPLSLGAVHLPLAMPLFLLVFFSFLLGALVGGTTTALTWRRNARRKQVAAIGKVLPDVGRTHTNEAKK